MADMMKDIIEEVLHRGGRRHGHTQVNAQPTPPPAPQAGSEGKKGSITNLYRPNYQKQKQQNRLGDFAHAHSSSGRPVNNEVRRAAPIAVEKVTDEFRENQMSALQRLAISQVTQRSAVRVDQAPTTEAPALIGKTKEGECIWFYPTVDSNLGKLLHNQNKCGMSAGIITRENRGSGMLFLLDEWQGTLPDATYDVLPEAVLIFSNDKGKLKQLLETAYRDLNRRRIQGNKIYQAAQPSSLLKQNLKIADGASAALIEGVSYFNSVALLERCFAKMPNLSLSYDVMENELFITGQPSFVDSAIQQIKQDIEQLLV